MALKGITRIELTDANTGEKKVVEKHNLVTNAVADMCKPLSSSCIPVTKYVDTSKNLLNVAKCLFGGIYLFNQPLDDSDPNDYIIPSDNDIVGAATYDAYSGTVQERGSYNQTESGVQDDGSYRHVWDFTTNQANGTISAVGLTSWASPLGGLCGSSWNLNDTHTFIKSYSSGKTLDTQKAYTNTPLCVVDDVLYIIDRYQDDSSNNYQWVKSQNPTVKISKYNFDSNKLKINSNISTGEMSFIETVEVPIPQEILNQFSSDNIKLRQWTYHDGCFCISFNSSTILDGTILANATMKFLCINIKNSCSAEMKEITNTTTFPITYYYGGFIIPYNDYCIIHSDKSDYMTAYVLETNNSTNIKKIIVDGTFDYLSTSVAIYSGYSNITRAGNLLFMSGNWNSSSYNSLSVINISKPSITLMQCVSSSSRENFINCGAYLRGGTYLYIYVNDIKAGELPCLLTTKNNIGEAVTKTSSQSMKITYTLTDAYEPDPEPEETTNGGA